MQKDKFPSGCIHDQRYNKNIVVALKTHHSNVFVVVVGWSVCKTIGYAQSEGLGGSPRVLFNRYGDVPIKI